MTDFDKEFDLLKEWLEYKLTGILHTYRFTGKYEDKHIHSFEYFKQVKESGYELFFINNEQLLFLKKINAFEQAYFNR